MAKNTISVRVGLEGGQSVERELIQIGEAGTAAFKALQSAAEDVRTATTGLAANVATLRERLSGVGEAVQRVGGNFSFLGGEIARVGATILSALSVRAIIDMTSAWADLTGRIRNAIPAGEDAAAVMQRLVDVANNSYQSIEATADSFATSARALRELGLTMDKSIDLFEAMNASLTLSGARGVQATSVLRALTRAMQEGSLRGANFQAVMDNGSRVIDVLADHLGVGVAQLKEMARQGKITSDVIQKALLGSLGKLREDLENMDDTILDGLLKIHNAMLQWVGTTDEATGFSRTLAGALVWVAENFDTVAIAVGTVIGLFLTLKAIKLAVDIFLLGRALIALIPPLVAVSVTMLTTPWGLMALGLAAAAIAILAITGNLDGFIDVIGGAVSNLLDFSGAAEEAGGDADKALKNAGASAEQVGASTQRAAASVDSLASATNTFADESEDAAKSAKKLGEEGEEAGSIIHRGMEEASPSVVQIAEDADRATESFVRLADAAKEAARAIAAANEGGGGGGGSGTGMRSGGRVVGPGSGTSDSIMAWLSNGEYVVKARAVRRYGTRFLHAVNTMQLDMPKLASGGLINLPKLSGSLAVPRFADGGLVNAALNVNLPDAGGPTGRPLTLNIDGESFDGLVAPEDVATRLTQYATSRQMRRAGRAPSWYRG